MKKNIFFLLFSLSTMLAPYAVSAASRDVVVPKPRVDETVMNYSGCVGSFQGAFSDTDASVNWSKKNHCNGGLSTENPGNLASISPSAHAYGFHVSDIIFTEGSYVLNDLGESIYGNRECVGTVKGIYPNGMLLVLWTKQNNCKAGFGVAGPNDGNTYLKSSSCHDVRSCLSQMNTVSQTDRRPGSAGVSTQSRVAKRHGRSGDGQVHTDNQVAQSKAD